MVDSCEKQGGKCDEEPRIAEREPECGRSEYSTRVHEGHNLRRGWYE